MRIDTSCAAGPDSPGKATLISTFATALALALFFSVAPPALASPKDELTRAATAIPDKGQETGEQFLSGFTATAVRIKRREIPAYVSAALHLRADLAPGITAAALTVVINNPPAERRSECALISKIIAAAIEANPAEAVAIVQAALEVTPNFSECIVTAAIAAAPDQKVAILRAAQTHPTLFAFLRLTRTENGGIPIERVGALNPASLTVHNTVVVISPEQVPAQP